MLTSSLTKVCHINKKVQASLIVIFIIFNRTGYLLLEVSSIFKTHDYVEDT
jgi:hypothetical protein